MGALQGSALPFVANVNCAVSTSTMVDVGLNAISDAFADWKEEVLFFGSIVAGQSGCGPYTLHRALPGGFPVFALIDQIFQL